jgi:thiosulfate dehydrogenase
MEVANGIRLTGMPGFNQQLSTTQRWKVSLLLANADKLPEAAKTVLANPNSSPSPRRRAPTPEAY